MVGDARPREKFGGGLMLNGCIITVSSKYGYLNSEINTALSLNQRKFFLQRVKVEAETHTKLAQVLRVSNF